MAYQNLFEAIIRVTGFTPLESDMTEIMDAYHKDMGRNDKDIFGDTVPTTYFKSSTTKKDDGLMMCYCGNSGIDNNDHYVVTTHNLKSDEVPELCMDAKTYSELLAKLLKEYYNK